MVDTSAEVAVLLALLRAYTYAYDSESGLQAGIAAMLEREGVGYAREVVLGPRARIDFLLGDIGVEIKTQGSPSSVTAQLFRYAESPRVAALVLVTDRHQLVVQPPTLLGKPLRVVSLLGGLR